MAKYLVKHRIRLYSVILSTGYVLIVFYSVKHRLGFHGVVLS
jgi:hypothetical protein